MIEVELVSYTQNPVNVIESAASTCYDSTPTDGRIMNHCYKSGHHSVLEFAEFAFKIKGISRAAANQLVRHRLASFAQRSQRYVTENGFQYVIPPKIKNDPQALDLYENLMNYISRTYSELLERNIEPEDARFVLPNACETEICVKMDLRELIHFCNERLCACAQWEIRQLASKMKEKVVEVEPKFAPYLVPKCEKLSPYSFCTESKKRSCGRHPVIGDIFKKAENKNE